LRFGPWRTIGRPSMKITIVGTGYVGLVAGAAMAEAGNKVTCVDIDHKKIESLSLGTITIYEPGLSELVSQNLALGRLCFTSELANSINDSDIIFIAVGTPPHEDGSADLSHVLGVAEQISKIAKKSLLIGTKSTVPVGTGDKIKEIFKNSPFPAQVFSNPEFLKEGHAINDFMKPDRIIMGIDNGDLKPIFSELYAPFMRQKDRLIFMDIKSAELTKYAANAMLATRISFMNELAKLCEKTGANINDVRYGIGSDSRIGPSFLFPGLGFGGSCFPKDIRALLHMAKKNDLKLSVVEAGYEANQSQTDFLFQKICNHFGGIQKLKNLKLAFWGLSFKANTDDIRESPAIKLALKLKKQGAEICAYDSHALNNIKLLYGNDFTYFTHNYECLKGAHALIIGTESNEFRSPDYKQIKQLLKTPLIFDYKNLLNAKAIHENGITYYGIGFGGHP